MDVREARRNIILNQPHKDYILTPYGHAAFNENDSLPLSDCLVFSYPYQGEGTPSVENPLNYLNWTGYTIQHGGKNLLQIAAYSASNVDGYNGTLTNNYGTTINTTSWDGSTPLIVTQTAYESTPIHSYRNGYCCIIPNINSVPFDRYYDVSFRVTDIVSNPLNATISDIQAMSPSNHQGTKYVNGDTITFAGMYWGPRSGWNQLTLEIRNCGMSCTFSDFMFTPSNNKRNGGTHLIEVEDRTYEPFTMPTFYSYYFNPNPDSVRCGGYSDFVNGWHSVTHVLVDGYWGDIKDGTPDATTGYDRGVLEFSEDVLPKSAQSDYGIYIGCNVTNSVSNAGKDVAANHFYVGENNKAYIFLPSTTPDNTHIQILGARQWIDVDSTTEPTFNFKSNEGWNTVRVNGTNISMVKLGHWTRK